MAKEHNEQDDKEFPVDRFELLVKLYLDGAVDWDVMHNFAIAHIDDSYQPEFQRPVEDLHMMFLPEYRIDAENPFERPHMKYLLSLLENLKHEVNHLGAEPIRQREIDRMASEDPSKHFNRAEYRKKHRRKPN